ncbi:SixA phosphatase family protein [Mucilaginibacter lacusdianchii]|uniref:SixA phosphatase family protein n=1 Tax=Mucilaginibacter lacusdianchii TaxID=2684211 RepID=UPI00131C8844|nr:histidine phosphatase family protein [Mucilaginibacter sp. JXJ CY 39]
MKKLLLIRHADAVAYADGGDFYRPLSETGKKAAAKTAAFLPTQHLIPQLIICSPAVRTVSTAQIITQSLNLPVAKTIDKIYDADDKTLLSIVNEINNEFNFIALIGHNPGISYLSCNLSSEVREVPPGTAIVLNFDTEDWACVSNGLGYIVYYFAP